VSGPGPASGGVGQQIVVRRRPGLLVRSTAAGYLLHNGREVVPLTGADAEVWAQIADEVPVDVLVGRQAELWDSDWKDTAPRVLAILAALQEVRAVEFVGR
jgi:hypothetical protein